MSKNLYFILFLFISTLANSQKIATVDMRTILEKMPEYKVVTNQLDYISKIWEGEIFEKEKKIKAIKEEYNKEELFYTENIKQKKIKEIEDLEKETYDLSKNYFGYEGALFKKRVELIKPLQDKIYEIIQRVSKERMLELVIDKSAGSYIMYMETKIDITSRVLQLLGF